MVGGRRVGGVGRWKDLGWDGIKWDGYVVGWDGVWWDSGLAGGTVRTGEYLVAECVVK